MQAISERTLGSTPSQNEYASSTSKSLRILAVNANEIQENSDIFDVLKKVGQRVIKRTKEFIVLTQNEVYLGNDTVQKYLSMLLSKNEFTVKELLFCFQKIGCRWRAEILNILQISLLKSVLPKKKDIKFKSDTDSFLKHAYCFIRIMN